MKNNSQKLGYFIVALGALFYFYEYFLRIAPSVMKPELMHSFGLNATLFGALSGAYFFAYTPMQIIVGVLVDKLSLRFVLTMSVLCCMIGSLLIATTHDYNIAWIGRFLQGFGSAFAFVGALKLAAMWMPVERFAFFAGSCAALGFFGAGLGEYTLTYAVQGFGWRLSIQAFTVLGAILAVLFFIFLRFTPDYTDSHHISAKAVDMHKLTFKEAGKQLFELIKKPYIWVAGILSYLMFLPTSVFAALWGIPYLERTHELSPHLASTASSLIFIGWAVGAPIQGWLSDRYNTRIKVIFVGAVGAAVLSLIALYVPILPYSMLCITLLLFGIFSSVQVLTFAMARDLCSSRVAGMAIAFVNTLAMVGGFIFQPGVGKLLDLSGDWVVHNGIRVYSTLAYEKALAVIPICLIIAAVIAAIVKRRHLRTKIDRSVQTHSVKV